MNFIDLIYCGWYQILDKTVYRTRFQDGTIGSREHAFFITFLIHGINISTILRYLAIEYFESRIGLYTNLGQAIVIFIIGYWIYFKNKRADKILSINITMFKHCLFVGVSIVYVILSVYLMFKVGDYVRNKFVSLAPV